MNRAGRLGPRHDRGRLGIGDQPLVAVGDLLVVERARDHVRARVEHGSAAVHVEPLLAVAGGCAIGTIFERLVPCMSGSSKRT